MELTNNQLSHLMKRFPEFELSYETISHSKVSLDYNYALAVPVGKKFYAWFTFHQDKDVCYIFEINRDRKISKGRCIPMQSAVSTTLSLGTVLYGTVFESFPVEKEQTRFIIEDIFFFQGISLKRETFENKLEFLYQFMETLSDTKSSLPFILPVIWELSHPLSDEPPTLPENIGYITHHVQYRTKQVTMPYLNIYLNNVKKNIVSKPAQKMDVTALPLYLFESPKYKPDFNKPQYKFTTVFQVRADIQYDIYHLFAFGKNKELVYYNIAYIPNYKSSVFMNGLFRKIRENKNLDFIEESDDEDDFQNTKIDKYVNLEKTLNMECIFHPKYKKWIPVKVSDRNANVVHISKMVRGYDMDYSSRDDNRAYRPKPHYVR